MCEFAYLHGVFKCVFIRMCVCVYMRLRMDVCVCLCVFPCVYRWNQASTSSFCIIKHVCHFGVKVSLKKIT